MAKFMPGQSGNPNGRPKGAGKYRDRIDAVFADYDPLARLKELSLATQDEKIRALCDKELAQYYAPKLKAVEHSIDKESPLAFSININKKDTLGDDTAGTCNHVQCDENSE